MWINRVGAMDDTSMKACAATKSPRHQRDRQSRVVTFSVTKKRPASAGLLDATEGLDQSVITQPMIAFRSASLAADFGWPVPEESFLTAAST